MNTDPAANIAFRLGESESITGGCTGLSCEIMGVITDPAVVYGTVLASLFALVAFAYITEARERCRMERRRIADEQDAFREFATRLQEMEPTNPGSTSNRTGTTDGPWPNSPGPSTNRSATAPGGVRSIGGPEGHTASASAGSLDRVQTAYRETVMSVPHYDEEYGDGLLASVTAELGDDAAAAMVASDRFTPALKRALLAFSEDARRNRDSLTDAIDAERAALDTAEEQLGIIDRERRALHDHLTEDPTGPDFEAYVDVWHRLGYLDDRCGTVAEDRQDQLKHPPMQGVDWGPSFYDYLYSGLSVDHPVLATIGDLVADLRADRTRVERLMTEA